MGTGWTLLVVALGAGIAVLVGFCIARHIQKTEEEEGGCENAKTVRRMTIEFNAGAAELLDETAAFTENADKARVLRDALVCWAYINKLAKEHNDAEIGVYVESPDGELVRQTVVYRVSKGFDPDSSIGEQDQAPN